jgi:hypothetical protein
VTVLAKQICTNKGAQQDACQQAQFSIGESALFHNNPPDTKNADLINDEIHTFTVPKFTKFRRVLANFKKLTMSFDVGTYVKFYLNNT